MASATRIRRGLTTASSMCVALHGGCKSRSSVRFMSSASAMPLSLQEESPIDIQIFDIFDAPSRLGESSKLLVQTASARPSSARSTPASGDLAAATRYIKPLPVAVIFDGPARPKHLGLATYRARRERSTSSVSRASSHEKRTLCTLPPAVIFDGPSRLRPYTRDGGKEQKVDVALLAR
ncbi:hypothetical protein NM688_g5632 [Phlebia brevispora]|uniref:Uncharacterized protein n=1 Tax=Phlebia brevispora TaxID=194682 RepID=A0ACC1SS89_9APHY|nr:hypothetical protein NM688_g5632 [Phlebia brevispora]